MIRLLFAVITGLLTYGILILFNLDDGYGSNKIIIPFGVAGGWIGWYVYRYKMSKKH
jgi:hypothetical protein